MTVGWNRHLNGFKSVSITGLQEKKRFPETTIIDYAEHLASPVFTATNQLQPWHETFLCYKSQFKNEYPGITLLPRRQMEMYSNSLNIPLEIHWTCGLRAFSTSEFAFKSIILLIRKVSKKEKRLSGCATLFIRMRLSFWKTAFGKILLLYTVAWARLSISRMVLVKYCKYIPTRM